jgi:hypothetical protein
MHAKNEPIWLLLHVIRYGQCNEPMWWHSSGLLIIYDIIFPGGQLL